MEVSAEDGDVLVGDDARSRQVAFVELLDLHRLVGVQRHRQRVELTIARAFEQHLSVATTLGVSLTVLNWWTMVLVRVRTVHELVEN